MRTLVFSIIIAIVSVTAMLSCSQSGAGRDSSTSSETPAASFPPTAEGMALMSPIVKDYLALKNALAADNDKLAAAAGRNLAETLKTVDMGSIPAARHKNYRTITEDAITNSEQIRDHAGKIEQQRAYMVALSKDLNDLIALFGAPQKLYQDYCPMYNDGQGAMWISETEEIENPYYGSGMFSCGSVKKEY